MKRKIMALGAVLAWVCGVFGATHEGVQLWENGPLWAKTNMGASSGSDIGFWILATVYSSQRWDMAMVQQPIKSTRYICGVRLQIL